MSLILPTAQNMLLELYVHQLMAAAVSMYPTGESMGTAMPMSDVITSGRRQ